MFAPPADRSNVDKRESLAEVFSGLETFVDAYPDVRLWTSISVFELQPEAEQSDCWYHSRPQPVFMRRREA